MTLNMSDVDIKNVTIVPKLRGFVFVKADVQVQLPLMQLESKIKNVFHAAIDMAIYKKHFVLALFVSHCVSLSNE